MRLFILLSSTLLFACLIPTPSPGQSSQSAAPTAEPRRTEEQIEPYHKHHDTRHGHDHYYPDRGSVVRDLPRGTIGLNYAGLSYRYHEGVWYEPRGPAFLVVAPPIGMVVPSLPSFTTAIAERGGDTFLYLNDTYYRPRPDLGGYEVVNGPPDSLSQSSSELPMAAQSNASAAALPAAAAAPAAAMTAASAAPMAAAAPGTLVAPGALAAPGTFAAPGTLAAPSTLTAPGASGAPGTLAATTALGAPGTNTPTAGTMTASTVAAGATSAASSAGTAALAIPPPPPPTTPISMTTSSVPVPAPGLAAAAASTTPKGPKVFLYPKNGQNAEQQARDRYECYRFAVAQSGFDPMRAPGGAVQNTELQSDFERAQSACFDARGYASR